ncbi:polyribonucleotide nucleotidyltransferase [Candidatus Peregrinibacteria bacterium]|nr:polyribonucleotide nucleotidyltransferase [Candidatus Peregrinibacteria bacterium]
MEHKEVKMDLAGREFRIRNYPVSSYASGFALVSLGDTIVMGNASMSPKGKEGASFFPMTVDYEENMYAAGKIKGSRFIKREGRPSENATLISRMIDRPVRPLFPKNTTNEVQIICSALSADLEVDPATTAMNAASTALMVSGAPFAGPIGAVRMGYVNGELIVNPTYTQCEEGQMNLIVAGTLDAITMVEAAMKEVSEDIVVQAFEMAHKYIKQICELQLQYAKLFDVKKIEAEIAGHSEEALKAVHDFITEDMLEVSGKTKMDVKEKIHGIEDKLYEKFKKEIEEETFSQGDLADILNDMFEKHMRKNILTKGTRLDGRKLTEIRPITIIPDVLPRTHGSAIFQRGETMALTITTLGGPGDAQVVDTMEKDITKRYFHHYHFPPFAVGEIKMLRGPGRREIGHGDLAERALIPMLPSKEDFPYTMWLVSEVTRCNGSSSMASVCGSSLSLMCAGVPIKKPVAGIAMGLVSNPDNGDYKILSDIQGMEDFAGDMDFKVAGTKDGITALQMDIKIKGLSLDLMRKALAQAHEGRTFILDAMNSVIPEARKKLSKYAPLIMNITIDPELIRVVIGKGGETIQKITKECGVEMDIDDTGIVTITAPDQVSGEKAVEWVKKLTYMPKVGDVFDGTVVKIMEFGAFVEMVPGKDGLVHISELDNKRVNKVEDVVKLGDKVKVKLMKIDDQGRYNLSRKVLLGADSGMNGQSSAAFAKQEQGHVDEGKGGHGPIVKGTRHVRKVNGD